MALTEINSLGIKDAEVKTADIAADAVTGAKIADDAVGSEHIEQLDANLSFADSVSASFGAGADLLINHDGTNNYIGTQNGNILITKVSGTEKMVQAIPDGAVELYYDNVKTLNTTGSGIVVQGPEGGDGMVYIYADEGDDDADKWRNIAVNDGTFHIQNLASGSWETNI